MNTHVTRSAIIKARSGRNSSPLEVLLVVREGSRPVRVDFLLLVVVVSVEVGVIVVADGSLAAPWSSVNGLEGVSLVPVSLVPVAVLLLPVAVFLVLVSGSVASENI